MWLSNFKIVSDKCHIYDKLDGNISGTNHLKLKKLQGAQFWNKYFAEKIVQCPECVSSKCPIANVESYFHKGCQYFLRALEILGILRHFFPDSNKFFWPVFIFGWNCLRLYISNSSLSRILRSFASWPLLHNAAWKYTAMALALEVFYLMFSVNPS